MLGGYSRGRIGIYCALVAAPLLAACGDAEINFLTDEASLQTAIAQLLSAVGERVRVQ